MRRWRRHLRLWHRCFGIGAGLWLLLLAVTGSTIVFYDELDTLLNPELRSLATAQSGDVHLDDALDSAATAIPGFAVRFVDLPDCPTCTLMMLGSAPRHGGGTATVQVFADPRDGRLLGWRHSGILAFDRRHLMDTVYSLHMDVLLGPTMAWFLGLIALLWLVDHAAALVLAVPRPNKLPEAMRIGGTGFNMRRLYDLHRAPGLWAFPFTLLLAGTGLCLSWPDDARAFVSRWSPVSERLHYAYPDSAPIPGAKLMSLDEALGGVRRSTGRDIDSITLLARKGLHAFRAFDDRDLDGLGRLWIYVSMYDGRIVARRHDNGSSAGDTFFAWQYPIHSGKGFGWVGRLAVLAAGILTSLLCMSGILLFARRALRRRM